MYYFRLRVQQIFLKIYFTKRKCIITHGIFILHLNKSVIQLFTFFTFFI